MRQDSANDDIRLIEQVRKGDMDSFRLLVDKHKDMSLSLAQSILKDHIEAEDALQDAFIKVYKSIFKFKADAAFTTWLYRIVANTCYNALGRKKYFEDINEVNLEPSMPEGTKTGIDLLAEEDRKVYILAALDLMKPNEALALRLYYLCDMDLNEIIEITGFSESNVKVLLFRGRQNLHKYLIKIMGNETRQLL